MMTEFERLHEWLVSLQRPFEELDPFANTGALALKDVEGVLLYSREHAGCRTDLK